MSFSSFLLNTHLLLSIYALFILWKDDRLSQGTTLDDIARHHQTTATREGIMLTMLALCGLPILNVVTLYRLVLAEIETTRHGWILSKRQAVRHKRGLIIADCKGPI